MIFLISLLSSAADTDSITVTLTSANYTITNDESGYSTIDMKGFNSLTSPGDPMLPHKKFDILIPMEADGSSVKMSILSADFQVLEGTYDIKPTPPIASGQTTQVHWGVNANITGGKNMDVYGKDANYPVDYVKQLPISEMRKYKFVPVDFTAFQYNPISKKLTLIEVVTLQISYNLMPLTIAAQESLNVKKSDRVMDGLAPTLFYNYEEAKAWYEPAMASSAGNGYVILTTNAIRDTSTKLNAFKTHKQNQGYTLQIVTENDFGTLAGAERADKIRQWLKDNYLSGIKYVLLIGDPTPNGSGIPMKVCRPDGLNQTPTDAYYADLSGDWNKDGDGYFGEWSGDYYGVAGGVGFAPEVFVGRIPYYGSLTDLDSILQKTINYETEVDTTWRKSSLLPMSYSDASTDGARLSEQMINDYLSPKGYSRYRFYQRGSICPAANSTYPSEAELMGDSRVRDRWAANPVGIMCWWAHGNTQIAGCGYSGCDGGLFFTSGYCSALNNVKPAFTYLCSCLNGQPEDTNNLQYAQLKQGAIASCGATRISWYYMNQQYGEFDGSASNSGLGYEYFKRIVNGLSSAEALELAKEAIAPPSWEMLMNWYDFNIYGDPSIKISTANVPPSPPSNPSIPSGPKAGYTSVPYNYSTMATDPNNDQVKYTFNWGDNTDTTTGYVNSGATANASHSWSAAGTYLVKAMATDSTGASSGWSDNLTVTITVNSPPNPPRTPWGNTTGKTKTSYIYSTNATDPNLDQIKYTFNWGDRTTSTTSFFASGSNASASHKWNKAGTYQVKAMATDSNGATSAWSGNLSVQIGSATRKSLRPPRLPRPTIAEG